jgi:GH15 family glucan-1,4-alpha-glucosidase
LEPPLTQKVVAPAATGPAPTSYPPIAEYALIGDCHSSALVSRSGSIDWCCMPRVDSPSCFARLLDWQRGGYCSVVPEEEHCTSSRSYLQDTMVLSTVFTCTGGEARLIDGFSMRAGGRDSPHRELQRAVEGVRGEMAFRLEIVPRFDYGEIRPWVRRLGPHQVAFIGGSTGLLVTFDGDLEPMGDHGAGSRFRLRAGQRVRLSMRYFHPEHIDVDTPAPETAEDFDRRMDDTVAWWHTWAARCSLDGPDAPAVLRSALVLKALTNAPTGAIAAAPTTSLPEAMGGARNWDYRYSWVRDSAFSVHSLAQVGFDREADGFRRFIERSAAGSARDLQIMYGVGGERRLTEIVLPLEGYGGSKPVRIGNAASQQLQLDAYGELVMLSWEWFSRGHVPDDDYWRFLADLVDVASERCHEPDRGIWEIRGEPRHFVHSKVLCWAAMHYGIDLARRCGRTPPPRWSEAEAGVRAAIEEHGYDSRRGVFTQAFDSPAMDAALLLLPNTGFVDDRDPRMVRTVEAVRAELDFNGLLLRRDAGGRSGRGRGRLPELHLLAGGAPGTAGTHRRGPRRVRPRRRHRQRPGAVRRGMGPGGGVHAGELPPGSEPSVAHPRRRRPGGGGGRRPGRAARGDGHHRLTRRGDERHGTGADLTSRPGLRDPRDAERPAGRCPGGLPAAAPRTPQAPRYSGAFSTCSSQSKPMALTSRFVAEIRRAGRSGSALKCWCITYGGT